MGAKSIRKSFTRDFYFKAADERFVREEASFSETSPHEPLSSYKFRKPSTFVTPKTFKKNAQPLAFSTTPNKLVELAVAVVKELNWPSVYTWQIEEVCRWLRSYGYPQYQNAFRLNVINGRTLLLLDVSALSAMNIQNFEHLTNIAYGIRCLFQFQLTYFARSISLPPQHYFELYKLLRVKNGTKYELSQAIDLWRRMKLIRPPEEIRDHWDILDRWIHFEDRTKEKELIGGIRRFNIYACKNTKRRTEVSEMKNYKSCMCMPPCECNWTNQEKRHPWKVLEAQPQHEGRSSKHNSNYLSLLQLSFPERYGKQKVDTFFYTENFV